MRFFIFFLICTFAFANGFSEAQIRKGKKIVDVFCDKDRLSGLTTITKESLKTGGVCQNVDDEKLDAIIAYLNSKKSITVKKIDVPKDAKCPVCGMFVAKYPKWACMMVIDGKKYYFDGVKDMMKFYFFDKDFVYDRDKIEKVLVQDFYTLEAIDATKAYYVIGSNMYGPMGKELIPFKNLKEAKNFLNDHKGEKIVKFKDITINMVIEGN